MDRNKKLMKIKCKNFDKYGRLLVSIYSLDNKYINQILIEEGFAIEYSGGKKKNLLLNKYNYQNFILIYNNI